MLAVAYLALVVIAAAALNTYLSGGLAMSRQPVVAADPRQSLHGLPDPEFVDGPPGDEAIKGSEGTVIVTEDDGEPDVEIAPPVVAEAVVDLD